MGQAGRWGLCLSTQGAAVASSQEHACLWTLTPLSPAASVQLWRSRLGRVLYSMANCLLLMKVCGCRAVELLVLAESVSGRLQEGVVFQQA